MEREPMLRALADIADERRRQNEKWGQQDHDPTGWVAILVEEVGEVAKESTALLPPADRFDIAAYRAEMVQVAAVAVQAIECLDRNEAP